MKIPSVMATQHPDNAGNPFWHHSPYISSLDEVKECVISFQELGCDEYMWDWEGKFVDEAVVDRLLTDYEKFFRKKQLGRDIFLTFRIPNIWKEKTHRLPRCFMAITTASDEAITRGFHSPPVFQIILPMTDSAEKMIEMENQYRKIVELKKNVFSTSVSGPEDIDVIPLLEGFSELTKIEEILNNYVALHEKTFGKVTYIRPFIARSDPALESGYLSALLSSKIALSICFDFEKKWGGKIYPIIGVGSPVFRGGLTPYSIKKFFTVYSGIKTVTVQSAFRYDNPVPVVKRAIKKIKEFTKNSIPHILTRNEISELYELSEKSGELYRKSLFKIQNTILQFAQFIPRRRERIQHTGYFGYSRKIPGSKENFPRAIPFVGSCYTLGLPPELIGLASFLMSYEDSLKLIIKKINPHLINEIKNLMRMVNKENIFLLAKLEKKWKEILEEIEFLEKYFKTKCLPKSIEEFLHRNHSSSALILFLNGKDPEEEIIQCAKIRRFLG